MKLNWRVHEPYSPKWSQKQDATQLSPGDVIMLRDPLHVVGNDETGMFVMSTAEVYRKQRLMLMYRISPASRKVDKDVGGLLNVELVMDDAWEHMRTISTNRIEILLPKISKTVIPYVREKEDSTYQLLVPDIDVEGITGKDVVSELEPQIDQISSALVEEVTDISTVTDEVTRGL